MNMTLIASCHTNLFFSQSRYSKCSKKISAKNKRLLFSLVQNPRNFTPQKLTVLRYLIEMGVSKKPR